MHYLREGIMQDREAVFAAIVEVAAELEDGFDPARLRPDATPFKSYGLNSLQLVRLAGLVEERFEITINDVDLLVAASVAGLIDVVLERAARPAGAAR
jgi:acyl carrier protein